MAVTIYTETDNGLCKDANLLDALEKKAEDYYAKAFSGKPEKNVDAFLKLLELSIEQKEVKKRIKKILIDYPVAHIHQPIPREILRKVQQDHPFITDKIEKAAARLAIEKGLINEENSTDNELVDKREPSLEECDELIDTFYSWMDPYTYIRALYDLRALIVRDTVSEKIILDLIHEARNCYALRQYNAVFSVCRTTIEVTCRKRFVSLGLNADGRGSVKDIDGYPAIKIIRDATKKLEKLQERITEKYETACNVVHGKEQATQEGAREMFKDTLCFVEELSEAGR